MTFSSLLPPASTALQKALERVGAEMLDIPILVRAVKSADDSPLQFLPWLAWERSLDNWSSDWPEAIRRERVRKAIPIARRKGTAASVRAVVQSFGGSVALREWWQMEPKGVPHTFSLLLNLDREGAPASAAFVESVIAEVTRTKPARSHFTFTQGLTAKGSIGLIGALRPAVCARLSCTAPASNEVGDLPAGTVFVTSTGASGNRIMLPATDADGNPVAVTARIR